jgi:hypothetical protein
MNMVSERQRATETLLVCMVPCFIQNGKNMDLTKTLYRRSRRIMFS